MKIIVIGDIHGHDSWKRIIDQEKTYDLLIFLGDYFDSFSKSSLTQYENYLDIAIFRDSSSNIITLLGNHEFHYLYPTRFSGWNANTQIIAEEVLQKDLKNKKLKFAYQYKNILFSHAGITKTWLNEVMKISLDGVLNNEIPLAYLDFQDQGVDNMYGDSINNGPLWVRPRSLQKDSLDDYIQVVGHTHMKGKITINEDKLYFCDSLPNEYLVIENDEFIIKELNNELN